MIQRLPLIAWLLVLLLMLVGCASSSPRTACHTAAAERFQQYVSDLAHPRMEGRGVGYEGLDLARDYLVTHFADLGLEPAFLDSDGQRSYTQAVEVQLGPQASEQRLSVRTRAGERAFEAGHAFNALGFSSQGGFAGEAVFVGYGIVAPEHGYDSYAGLGEGGLAGKVAIAFRYEPVDGRGRSRWAGVDGRLGRFSDAASLPRKAEWAAERGAAALLVVDPPGLESTGPLRSTAGTDFGERAAAIPVMHIRPSALHALLVEAGRSPLTAVRAWEERANRGIDQPDVLAGVHLAGEVRLTYPHATVHNVAGYVPGSGGLAGEVVVIGAHYDHLGYGEVGSLADADDLPALHPGADDNASGTAGLMILAERAVAWVEGSGGGDRRSLLFVGFSGEERGLLGSMHLVQRPSELGLPFEGIAAMLNLDMIGRLGSELFVFGTGTGDRWDDLLEQANAGVGLRLNRAGSGIGVSDQTSFYLQRIPVLHFFTGIHDDYHRPTDTAERVNALGGARVVELADRLVRLLAVDRRMSFTGTADPHAGMIQHRDDDAAVGGLGRARLGVVPDYATLEGEQGAGLAGVLPGSPAEAAGLQAGDRILEWDGRGVSNVRSFTRLLGAAEPGDQVELVVERDGRRRTVEVELGRR